MSFTFTEEQDELRGLVREFSADKASSQAVRALIGTGAAGDPGVWQQLAEELGLTAIPIPVEYGGAGYGAVELGIVLEEMGRALFVSPYFATVGLAAQTLLAFDDEEARRRWLPGIADGSLTATVAIESTEAHAEKSADGWTITGSTWFVPDGCTADLVLVVARTDAGPGLFAVTGDAPGLTRVSLAALDLTRDLARIDFADTPATAIGDGDGAALERARNAIYTAVAAEQIGGAARCLDMAVEYAKIRVQFGRPIGSFQAIKHKCVEMLLDIESGRSASHYASAAVASGGADAAEAASIAKAMCSLAFTNAAKENIQIHGGIGYTWEHDAHLYLRRAKTTELMFGTPATHRARLAGLVGIQR